MKNPIEFIEQEVGPKYTWKSYYSINAWKIKSVKPITFKLEGLI